MDPAGETSSHQETGSSSASVDWAAAFKSHKFSSGLQTVVADAIAKTIGARASSEAQVAALEQLGEVCPTAMVSAPGTQTPGECMLTAPSFVGISGSMSLTQSSAIAQFQVMPAVQQFLNPSLHYLPCRQWPQSSLYTGTRSPQILAYKFVEMSDLIPENLEARSPRYPPLGTGH